MTKQSAEVEKVIVAAVALYACVDTWANMRNERKLTPEEGAMIRASDRLFKALQKLERAKKP
jgi:hypothetical protein